MDFLNKLFNRLSDVPDPIGDEAVDLDDAPEDNPGDEGDNSELAKDYPDLQPAPDDPSRSV